jgi:hypothetical protein
MAAYVIISVVEYIIIMGAYIYYGGISYNSYDAITYRTVTWIVIYGATPFSHPDNAVHTSNWKRINSTLFCQTCWLTDWLTDWLRKHNWSKLKNSLKPCWLRKQAQLTKEIRRGNNVLYSNPEKAFKLIIPILYGLSRRESPRQSSRGHTLSMDDFDWATKIMYVS